MLNFKGMTVLDIGSEYMSLFVFKKDGQYPIVSAFARQKYSGFQDGEFLSPEEIYPVIKGLIESLYLRFKVKIKNIAVSIPGEFTCVVNKDVEKDIDKRVKQKDVDELFAIGNTYQNHNNFEVIASQGVYYKTNANPQRLIDPIGEECDSIAAKVSYILCERYYTDTLRAVANNLKIKVKFVSSIVSQIEYVSQKMELSSFQDAILIDLGFLTTTVAYFMGDRAVDIKTFSIGGGSSAGDITLVTDIPFSHSYKLYKKANLNIQPQEDDCYNIHCDKENFSYDIKTINAILEERIYNIGEHLAAAIYNTGINLQEDTPVFLSGCSICQNRGVREIIEASIGKKIYIMHEDLFDRDSTENVSIVALINKL